MGLCKILIQKVWGYLFWLDGECYDTKKPWHLQVCFQCCGGHLEHILWRIRLLCKGISMTETLGNDCTWTEV